MTVCGVDVVASRIALAIVAAVAVGSLLVLWPAANWVSQRYERREVHKHVQRRLHVHDYVIVEEITGEPVYARCVCGAKRPRERIESA